MVLQLCAVNSWNCPNWRGYKTQGEILKTLRRKMRMKVAVMKLSFLIKMDTGIEASNIGIQDTPTVLSDSEEKEMIAFLISRK